jgi:hypothetical protein
LLNSIFDRLLVVFFEDQVSVRSFRLNAKLEALVEMVLYFLNATLVYCELTARLLTLNRVD